MWRIIYTKQAQKDARRVDASGLRSKVEKILDVIRENPYNPTHRLEKLSGELAGYYLRRITAKHRLLYDIHEEEQTIRVVRMWTHYE